MDVPYERENQWSQISRKYSIGDATSITESYVLLKQTMIYENGYSPPFVWQVSTFPKANILDDEQGNCNQTQNADIHVFVQIPAFTGN